MKTTIEANFKTWNASQKLFNRFLEYASQRNNQDVDDDFRKVVAALLEVNYEERKERVKESIVVSIGVYFCAFSLFQEREEELKKNRYSSWNDRSVDGVLNFYDCAKRGARNDIADALNLKTIDERWTFFYLLADFYRSTVEKP
jgi:hypothetical protein